jgi:diacylglycerol kinase
MMKRIKKLLRSFRHAASGLRWALREQNFQIELVTGAVALLLAAYFRISPWQLAVLSMIILLVLILEIINTIFERVIDILVPRQHPYAKVIKDMMAGAVLLACFGSVIIGIIIFLPYLAAWLDKN